METKVLERLKRLGVAEELVEPEKFKKALQIGPKSPDFTKIVAKLTEELTLRYDMDETVHAVNSPDDASSFLLELSSFLKELGCVNEKLMTGNVNQRLETEDDKNILLDYLTAEVRTCRLLQAKNIPNPSCMDIDAEETEAAKDLKGMLTVLQSHKPLKNITPAVLFKSIEGKIRAIMETSAEIIGKPLITDELSESQWEELSNVYQEFHSDYTIRRTMLIERADVTAQSLLWSDRARAQEAKIKAKYYETRKQLSAEPSVALIDLLAARESDVAVMEKTSNPTVTRNTQSEINSVVIGEVPDRGGRPYEQEPPPPEMPSWQKERAPGPPSFSGGRGGGGGGPDRGGYYRGGRGGGKGAGGYTGGGTLGGFTGGSGDFAGGSGAFAGGSGGFTGGSGGFTGGSGTFVGGSGGYQGVAGGYQGATGGYQGTSGRYQRGSRGYQGGSRGYQGGSGGYQGMAGGFAGGSGGGYVEKSTPYSGMAGANVAGLQSGSSGFGNENQGDRYEGGGGNGFGGRNKGGEEFRVCKDAKDSKHNDYHQPQYSGYGHRYCYPSSGSCALPPESDSKQGQGHRGRNGNRGKGGRGGWNQSGNNSGNYQRGGYNRGKGRTERQN